mmetsp:Transcript_42318/g.97983  ORF Transcript_42318/g.97983 Transcript_42318/m.97983 type:complete len:87 (-) Transcript_42318:318-578(-)
MSLRQIRGELSDVCGLEAEPQNTFSHVPRLGNIAVFAVSWVFFLFRCAITVLAVVVTLGLFIAFCGLAAPTANDLQQPCKTVRRVH